MQKLFDAAVDLPLVLSAANDEFPRAHGPDAESAEHTPSEMSGWNAFEIWRSRIRLRPGASSLFLPFLEVR
jgi:hypothetical protein